MYEIVFELLLTGFLFSYHFINFLVYGVMS